MLLLRHGSTTASATGAFTGRSDAALTDEGRTQASHWRAVLAGRATAAFTSPLSRAAQTASVAGLAATPSDLLLEWDLGSLEGVPADVFRGAHPGWNLFTDGIPDGSGETPAAVAARAQSVWDLLTAVDAEMCVAVSHGQFLKALVTHAVGLPPAAAAVFSLGPGRAGLVSLRGSGRFSITGWNLSPIGPVHGLLSELT